MKKIIIYIVKIVEKKGCGRGSQSEIFKIDIFYMVYSSRGLQENVVETNTVLNNGSIVLSSAILGLEDYQCLELCISSWIILLPTPRVNKGDIRPQHVKRIPP